MGETTTVTVECQRAPAAAKPSDRVSAVALQFGIAPYGQPQSVLDRLDVRLGPGRIVLLLGPSGSGKSTALNLIADECPGSHRVDGAAFPTDRSIVDAVGPDDTLPSALELLTACGLGEAHLWLRRIDELSDGQRFRARLARAISLHQRPCRDNASSPKGEPNCPPLICDDFGCGLHRRLTKAIAFNLRKLATRQRLCFVLASLDEDVVADLQADTVIRLHGRGRYQAKDHTPRSQSISFQRRLVIEPGSKGDYHAFAEMHYRSTDELGFVDRVFVLRDRSEGDLLGIVVYAHPPLELKLRNEVTAGRFLRNPHRLNREMRILRRLVIHPDVRGCGLGHRLVRRTLLRVGTPFVECLASMGEVNPVFERAGMTRVGTCPVPANRAAALQALQALDVDPFAREFVGQVCRRPRVRRLVARFVYEWYQATTGRGEARVARQSPQFLARTFRGLIGVRPVYFLWQRSGPGGTPSPRTGSAARPKKPVRKIQKHKGGDRRVRPPSA